MDAASYLLRQGWRGDGYTLHGTRDGEADKPRPGPKAGLGSTSQRGLAKPLIVSRKDDTLGIGKKRKGHDLADQWWLRAFDKSLTGLGEVGSSPKKPRIDAAQDQIGTASNVLPGFGTPEGLGGLYGRFVQGQSLQGTIRKRESDGSEHRKSKKRKLEETYARPHRLLAVDVPQAEGSSVSSKRSRSPGSAARKEVRRARKAAKLEASTNGDTMGDSQAQSMKRKQTSSEEASPINITSKDERRKKTKKSHEASHEEATATAAAQDAAAKVDPPTSSKTSRSASQDSSEQENLRGQKRKRRTKVKERSKKNKKRRRKD